MFFSQIIVLRKEELILSRLPHSFQSVMVWGAVSYYGTLSLEVLTGKQTAEKHKLLLQQQTQTMNELFQEKKNGYYNRTMHLYTHRESSYGLDEKSEHLQFKLASIFRRL